MIFSISCFADLKSTNGIIRISVDSSNQTNFIMSSNSIGVLTNNPTDNMDVNGGITLSGSGNELNAGVNTIYFAKQESTTTTGNTTIDWRKGNKVEHTLTGNVQYVFAPLQVFAILF